MMEWACCFGIEQILQCVHSHKKNDHCGVSNKSTHHLRIMSIDCKTEAKRATELIDSILSKIVAIGVSMKNNDNRLEWRCR